MYKEKSSTPEDEEKRIRRRLIQFIVFFISMPIFAIFDSQIHALLEATGISFYGLCNSFLLLILLIYFIIKECVKLLKGKFIMKK